MVEDNEPSRDALARRLERRGHAVVTAMDGQQAVDLAGATRPDVILMDLGLPVIDGFEATRRLSIFGRAENAHIPICLSASRPASG